MNRRTFLACSAAGLLPLHGASGKPLRGVFPIAQSPFTEADKLDVDTLVAELRFIDKGRVHGFVWPQLASEWATLSRDERFAGTEAVCAEGKRLKPAVVIGVQAEEIAAAVEYARHAAEARRRRPHCPAPAETDRSESDTGVLQDVGQATELPLIVQAVGNLSVDAVVEIVQGGSDGARGQGRGGRAADADRGVSGEDERSAAHLHREPRPDDDRRNDARPVGDDAGGFVRRSCMRPRGISGRPGNGARQWTCSDGRPC